MMVAGKLTEAGMQSNLLAAPNRLSGVDGGPDVSGGFLRCLAAVRPAALYSSTPRDSTCRPSFVFSFWLVSSTVVS